MSQVVDYVCEEAVLFDLHCDSSASEVREDSTDMLDMSLRRFSEDLYVV